LAVLHGGDPGFFRLGRPGGGGGGLIAPDRILDAYFDAARFWRDVEHVMGLGIEDLALYLEQAARIARAEAAAARDREG
jgi:hypothetical protein